MQERFSSHLEKGFKSVDDFLVFIRDYDISRYIYYPEDLVYIHGNLLSALSKIVLREVSVYKELRKLEFQLSLKKAEFMSDEGNRKLRISDIEMIILKENAEMCAKIEDLKIELDNLRAQKEILKKFQYSLMEIRQIKFYSNEGKID